MTKPAHTPDIARDIRADLRRRLIAKDITPQRADELLALADAVGKEVKAT
jgi:hypothetical protein